MNRDYLRELIAETRRNETLGWALVVVGTLALIIMIYFQQLVSDSGQFTNFLVFMLTIVQMGIGVTLAGYYGSKKKKYMKKLRES